MAGSGTTMMQEAEETTRRLMARVTDFLCAHHLPPSPANYAFAYQLVSNPDGMLAKAVATIADGGVRLTQADLDRIGGPGAADADAARQVAHNQALVARTHDQVLGFD